MSHIHTTTTTQQLLREAEHQASRLSRHGQALRAVADLTRRERLADAPHMVLGCDDMSALFEVMGEAIIHNAAQLDGLVTRASKEHTPAP